jgi:hypothetical protein
MSDINKSLELVVKVLVAAIAGILGLFVLGWVMRGLGGLMLGLGGLLVALLKFIVPVAVIAGIVYFAVSQLRPKATDRAQSGRSDSGLSGVGHSAVVTGTVDVEVKPDHHEASTTNPNLNTSSTAEAGQKRAVTIEIDVNKD